MLLKYFCAWLLQFWNDQSNVQWLHVFWIFSFWPGASFDCLQQSRPRLLPKSQMSTCKHCMLALHRLPAKSTALLNMLKYAKTATGAELKSSWRDKDLFKKLMILIPTACFRKGVFSESLIISEYSVCWTAVCVSILHSLCLLFRILQKDSTLFWDGMKTIFKISQGIKDLFSR